MNWDQIYLDTFIPELPKHWNYNFNSVQRAMDVFYDGSLGILTKPLTTTGKVKAANGEFVTAVVDNLVVKNQFTNLYDNNTTADYNFYRLYMDPAVTPRDACTASTWWPQENPNYKYVDVNKPYYKITNENPLVFRNDNLSQVIGIFLDPSLINDSSLFKVILNPNPASPAYFTADPSAVGDPSMGTGFYVEFIATAYDPSWGTTWSQYKYGIVGTGNGSGGGGDLSILGTAGHLSMFTFPNQIGDSPLIITGTDLNTFAQNVDGVITLTNKKVTGVATPTNSSDAVNLVYANQFATNASVNITLGQFIRSSSTGPTLIWSGGILDISVNVTGASITYVDGSLAQRDILIATKANNASLGLYATNASVGLAGFAKNASFGLYATNASVGLALGSYATNSSVGLSLAPFATNTSVGTALSSRDVSIAWLNTNKANNASLGLYATNASVGLALGSYATNSSIGLAGFATNASVGLAIAPFATNVSVGTAIQNFATNSSVNTSLAQFIRSSSTGSGLIWNGPYLDISIGDASTAASLSYVNIMDVSNFVYLNYWKIQQSDVCTALIPYARLTDLYPYATNASVYIALSNYLDISTANSLFVSYAYVDGSLNNLESQLISLDNRVIILESSAGYASFAYVDGSLATRDSSIILLFSRLNTTDSSLLTLTQKWSLTDSSLAALTISSLNFATNVSVNAAGFAKNSSVNFLYGWQLSQDASIIINTGAISLFNANITAINSSISYLNLHTIKDVSLGNNFTWDASGYLDVSLAGISDAATNASLYSEVGLIDSAISDLNFIKADISALLPFATNASVGLAIQNFATNSSVNSALLPFATNSSIGLAGFATNASVGLVVTTINASIGLMATNASISLAGFATNASIGLAGFAQNASFNLYATNASIGLAGFATNSSINLAGFATNASIGLAHFLKEASIGTGFAWVAGMLDVSVAGGAGVSQAYVDGSLSTLNASVNTALSAYSTNASLGLSTFAQNASFNLYATNSSVGLVVTTINASIGLMATNSSIGLAGFATNASVNTALGAYTTNSSISLAGFATNASIGLAHFLKEASIGTGFAWVAGMLDVSVAGGAGVTSLAALTDVSVSSIADKSLIQYDIVSAKWKNVSPLDASAYFQSKITKLSPPDSSTTGTAGDWSYDASYLYICTSTNYWGRVALSAF